MDIGRTILLLIYISVLPACRENNEALKAHEPSTTNWASARFQMSGNTGHDFQKDLAEIEALGLVDRAPQDFLNAYPEATIDRWNIGYAIDKKTVWCDIRYRLPRSKEVLQREFGYSRSNSGKWSLMEPLTEQQGRQKMVLSSKRTVQLGTFEVISGTLVVGDPGDSLAASEMSGAVLTNCFSGKWQAQLVEKRFNSSRFPEASELLVLPAGMGDPAQLKWIKQPGKIGTDSGQIGAFDKTHFQDSAVVPKDLKWTYEGSKPADPSNLWYSYCCETTSSGRQAGTIPFGAVSTSGKGDGGYEFQLAYDAAGKVIGVWIVFVDDDGNG